MAEWGRDTPWRQGALLSAADLQAVGQISDGDKASIVGVVVSHDCDIAQTTDREPEIEIIVATVDPIADGNYLHGKNSRTLQVDASIDGESKSVKLELSALGKRRIGKEKIGSAKPIGALQTVDTEILQRWLASRYRRAAFSDEFNARLNNTGLRSMLEAVLKKSQHIGGIYFEIDGGEAVEHIGEDDPFALKIFILYSTERDPIEAEQEASGVCEKIRTEFSGKCSLRAEVWKNFELVDCIPVADTSMTLAQSNTFQRWTADHISYRTIPPGVIVDGERALLSEGG